MQYGTSEKVLNFKPAHNETSTNTHVILDTCQLKLGVGQSQSRSL